MTRKKTTPEEFRARVADMIVSQANDCEGCHWGTDGLMEELLTELGYGEAIALIQNTKRWYA